MNIASSYPGSLVEIRADRFCFLFDGLIFVVFREKQEEEEEAPRTDCLAPLEQVDSRNITNLFEATVRPKYILNLTNPAPAITKIDYSRVVGGLLEPMTQQEQLSFPQALVTVLIGGYVQTDHGRAPASLSLKVIVLDESSDRFIVATTPDFLTAYDLSADGIEIILKDNKDISVTYTRFNAIYEEGANTTPGSWRSARIIFAPQIRPGKICPSDIEKRSDQLATDIFITNESAENYQIVFSKSFARQYPYLCSHWLKKSTDKYQIEII